MKHRAIIVGAGRIGAGYSWADDSYTHAGAYRALSDRVELVGFVDPCQDRLNAAHEKWDWLDTYTSLDAALANSDPIQIFSICVGPDEQRAIMDRLRVYAPVKGIWCEKPFVSNKIPSAATQVNYIRRADPTHRYIASVPECVSRLVVYGKDDIHTRCHFEDLAKWWKCLLDYRVYDGPCAYIAQGAGTRFFDQGGVDGGECMKGMLGNLLDHLDKGTSLWSPAP